MPLPLILWGAAAGLAATGVFKGVQASGNFDKAKEIGRDAENRHKKSISLLEKKREKTQKYLENLGKVKLEAFTHQIKFLVDESKKRKSTSSKIAGFEESFTIENLKQMESIVLRSLEIEKGLGTGAVGGTLAAMGAYGAVGSLATASTGAAISGLSGVAATNATLAWLGGGALSAGGFGMAGGMVELGGIVLGPALAIGGFMLAGKAEEAVTQAQKYSAEVDIGIEKIELLKSGLGAIQKRAGELEGVIEKMISQFEKVKVPASASDELFFNMVKVGKCLKQVLEIAILDKDGQAISDIKPQLPSGFMLID